MGTNIAVDAYVLFALLTVISIGSIYLAGRIRRAPRTALCDLGVDCRADRTAGAAIDIPVPEPASQERQPRLSMRSPDRA